MLGINGWELVVLAIIALLVLGPEKLPGYAADAARMLRQLRRLAADAREEVTRDLGPEFRDISLQDLNPRTFVSKHLLDGEDFGLDDDEDQVDRRVRRNRHRAHDSSSTSPHTHRKVTGRAGAANPADSAHDGDLGSPDSGGRAGGATAAAPVSEQPPYDVDAT